MEEEDLIAKLDELRRLPAKNEIFEFKEAKTNYDFRKLGTYFSALSNEANLKNVDCAWLIFGVEDKKKEIVGTLFRTNPKYLQNLKKEIADQTNNRITFTEIYELNLPEGRVIMFQIPPASKGIPTSFLSHNYARENESLGGLSIEEFDRIRKQVIEEEDQLSFRNAGNFIPGSIEEVIKQNAPEPKYRNSFLVAAMVNLGMVDTIGSGIIKMFNFQRARSFPMPEYDFSKNRVKVTVIGKVLDMDYASVLAKDNSLSLPEIMMLDKVQKKKKLSEFEFKHLKKKKLVEGTRPNIFISARLAEKTGKRRNTQNSELLTSNII